MKELCFQIREFLPNLFFHFGCSLSNMFKFVDTVSYRKLYMNAEDGSKISMKSPLETSQLQTKLYVL